MCLIVIWMMTRWPCSGSISELLQDLYGWVPIKTPRCTRSCWKSLGMMYHLGDKWYTSCLGPFGPRMCQPCKRLSHMSLCCLYITGQESSPLGVWHVGVLSPCVGELSQKDLQQTNHPHNISPEGGSHEQLLTYTLGAWSSSQRSWTRWHLTITEYNTIMCCEV